MENKKSPDPAATTLATMLHHRLRVQQALGVIVRDLQERALVHDASKFREDEFAGFSRINTIARHHAYGSEEYRAALKSEAPTIRLHYSRNAHHPEYWDEPHEGISSPHMTLLDLMEMVADWYAAWTVYNGERPPSQQTTWAANIQTQKARFLDSGQLSANQWWVVEEMTHLLAGIE